MKFAMESPKCPALTRLGIAGATAFRIRSGIVVVGAGHMAQAAGNFGFSRLPSGMMIFSGRKKPSLLGSSGVVMI